MGMGGNGNVASHSRTSLLQSRIMPQSSMLQYKVGTLVWTRRKDAHLSADECAFTSLTSDIHHQPTCTVTVQALGLLYCVYCMVYFTDRISEGGNAIASISPFVRLFPLYLRNQLTVDHEPEMEPGHGSPGHQVTGSAILTGSGRVPGQCFRCADRCAVTRFLIECQNHLFYSN